jgi:ribosomal peptide maturation radical SAM protein 1
VSRAVIGDARPGAPPAPDGGCVLVAMPWLDPRCPSLAVGLLHATLARAGLPVASRSLHLAALERMAGAVAADGSPGALRRAVRQTLWAWESPERCLGVFAVPPLRPLPGPGEPDPLAGGALSPEQTELARRMREAAGGFLADCAAELRGLAPRVVGFSVSFTVAQLVASLALARRLKDADPRVQIVFGGGLAGPTGAALHHAFPFIDVVVRGRADATVVPLMEDLLAGRAPRPLPGLCVRRDGASVVLPGEPPTTSSMDELPVPDYDEYFERLERSPLKELLRPAVRLPIETSRGCWWGQRTQCRFCGHNSVDLAFRAKSPRRVAEEMLTLARRHRRVRLHAADEVLDPALLRAFAPRLVRRGFRLNVFFEVKASLTRRDIGLLAALGTDELQAGIESLSTPVLRLMRKGVTALHNLRFLKWCAEVGIAPLWNLLYGLPGEPAAAYAEMAALIPSFTHLQPPYEVTQVAITRHSPYFERPAEHGIAIAGRRSDLGTVLPLDEPTLTDLAYSFNARYLDGRDVARDFAPAAQAVAAWRAAWPADAGALRYRRGPGFLRIWDGRAGRQASFVLDDTEARIYLACDAGARPAAIVRALERESPTAPAVAEVRELLDALVDERLVFSEDGRYLSLALAERPPVPSVAAREVAP